ncbi:microtubule-destabilizing protein 60-like [Bidens hawaiensis]|uniref:microtubule-destabilizing protein 60-like n=1 Tax=Bidens hawaiensis TaxID=980011 RepID=UPI0040491B01
MESHNAGASTLLTPSKPKPSKKSKLPETVTSRNPTPSKSPLIKSKGVKSAVKKPVPVTSPNKIRQRKFVLAKKNSKPETLETLESVNCKCNKANSKLNKCVCIAYESLRASQDEFTKIGSVIIEEEQKENLIEKNPNLVIEPELGEGEVSGERLSGQMKRRRDKVLEVARQSIPSNGCGRVLHLVKAFENALTITKAKTDEEAEEETVKVPKWELPGLRPKAPVTEFSSPDMFLTSESLGLDSRGSCSSGSDHSKPSVSNRNLGGGRRSRRNSSESSATFKGRRGKRTVKTTPQQPFNLKTEQRGKSKQEEFTKKVQEMMIEQEKQRIRIAQGLPWTTDEPESLAKPPVKEITRPVDLVLHSDMRAVERAEFDQQVQEKLSYIEQFKLEKEKQQKLAEEEELKRLRKELVPKAQPMPIFDKPFVPKRSEKQPTMPKQPKIYNPQQKKMHGGH